MRPDAEVIPKDGWALDPEPAFPCGPLSWALSPLLLSLSAPIVVVLTWDLTL